MSRVRTRWLLTGLLEATSPLHIGSGREAPGVDATVQTDGQGRPIIPGTSLAGLLHDRIAEELVGRMPGSSGEDATKLSARRKAALTRLFGDSDLEVGASRIIIDDAPLAADSGVMPPVVRQGIGLSRRTGAVEPGVLYNREMLPAGSRFELRIEVDDAEGPEIEGAPADSDARWLAHTCTRVLVAGIRLGAATTRGLGAVRLLEPKLSRTGDLATRSGILALLRDTLEEDDGWSREGVEPLAPGTLRIAVDWRPRGSVMCGIASTGAVDTLPETVGDASDATESEQQYLRLVLPGSALKGALRTRAELITRTVLTGAGEDHVRSLGTLLRDSADERLGAVLALFGAPANSRPASGTRRSPGRDNGAPTGPEPGANEQRGRKGAVDVADCYSTTRIPADAWTNLLTAITTVRPGALTDPGNQPTEKEKKAAQRRAAQAALTKLNEALADLDRASGATPDTRGQNASAATPRFDIVDHVAIDRWTGGAASERLYAVLQPTVSAWRPIVLDLDARRLPAAQRNGAVGLLLIVLRDLAHGRIPLGRAVLRGMGDVEVTGIQVSVGSALGDLTELAGDPLDLRGTPATKADQLVTEWFDQTSRSVADAEASAVTP